MPRGEVVHLRKAPIFHLEAYNYIYGAAAVVGALAMAGLALFGSPLHARLPRALVASVTGAVGGFRQLHSGHIGDYIAWWTVGAAVLGPASLLLLA